MAIQTETLKKRNMKNNNGSSNSDGENDNHFLIRRGVLSQIGENRLKELLDLDTDVDEISAQLGVTSGTIRRYAKRLDVVVEKERRVDDNEDVVVYDETDSASSLEVGSDYDKKKKRGRPKGVPNRKTRATTRKSKEVALTDDVLRSLGELTVRAHSVSEPVETYVERLRSMVNAWDRSRG